jgi:hypothetical protein
MEDMFKLMKIKELIKNGANIEIYDNRFSKNSLFEMAIEAKREKIQLKIHIRNSEFDDLLKILEGGGKYITLVFD